MTPEQIDDYCKRLAEAWKKQPDNQLVFIINQIRANTIDGWNWRISDEALITAIERMVEK